MAVAAPPVRPERIRELCAYFNGLVDMIPAEHYLDPEEAISLRYMKKAERASTKAAFKQQHKASKRARLDPDRDGSTTAVQQERDAGAKASTSTAAPLRANIFATASKEELQQRLQDKLEQFREQRKAKERSEVATEAKRWREQQHKQGKQRPPKRPRSESAPASRDAAGKAAGAAAGGKKQNDAAAQKRGGAPPSGAPAAPAAAQGDEVMFNKLTVQEGRVKKHRKLSKQQLLQQAQGAAAEGAAQGGGEVKWDKYMKLAQGEKVLDNPQLLRKAVKKEAKEKAKKAAAWKARNAATAEKQQAAQQRRQKNLQQRVDSKKAGKVAKREKKLMRPGFEGRTERLPKMPGS